MEFFDFLSHLGQHFFRFCQFSIRLLINFFACFQLTFKIVNALLRLRLSFCILSGRIFGSHQILPQLCYWLSFFQQLILKLFNLFYTSFLFFCHSLVFSNFRLLFSQTLLETLNLLCKCFWGTASLSYNSWTHSSNICWNSAFFIFRFFFAHFSHSESSCNSSTFCNSDIFKIKILRCSAFSNHSAKVYFDWTNNYSLFKSRRDKLNRTCFLLDGTILFSEKVGWSRECVIDFILSLVRCNFKFHRFVALGSSSPADHHDDWLLNMNCKFYDVHGDLAVHLIWYKPG